MRERDFNLIFSEKLKYYLEKYEMTQVDLAKRLGVGSTSIYNWLNGIKTPRMDKIDAMCEIFHCKRSDFMTDDSPSDAPEPPETPPAVNDTLSPRETSVVTKYRRLDDLDKGKIDERMDTLLEDEKYKRGESLDVRKIS